jgi:hypothetical protein
VQLSPKKRALDGQRVMGRDPLSDRECIVQGGEEARGRP